MARTAAQEKVAQAAKANAGDYKELTIADQIGIVKQAIRAMEDHHFRQSMDADALAAFEYEDTESNAGLIKQHESEVNGSKARLEFAKHQIDMAYAKLAKLEGEAPTPPEA